MVKSDSDLDLNKSPRYFYIQYDAGKLQVVLQRCRMSIADQRLKMYYKRKASNKNLVII